MGIAATYALEVALVLSLYGIKALLFRYVSSRRFVFAAYCIAIVLAVPVTWLLSPDWKNEHVLRIGIWVMDPVALLAVPFGSFLFDYFTGRSTMGRWYVRVPIEVLVLVPIWVYLCAWIAIFLGWVWI